MVVHSLSQAFVDSSNNRLETVSLVIHVVLAVGLARYPSDADGGQNRDIVLAVRIQLFWDLSIRLCSILCHSCALCSASP